MYVMSVTHTRFGAGAWNSRATTFGAIGRVCFESVVARYRSRTARRKAFATHQPRDALARDAVAERLKILVDPRAAVGRPTLSVRGPDHRDRAWSPRRHASRVVACSTRRSHSGTPSRGPAQQTRGQLGLLRVDEGELHPFSFAKKAAAFFRISRSMRRVFTSRRSAASSSRSAVVSSPWLASARVDLRLANPLPKRRLRQLEVPGHLRDRPAALDHQPDRLGLELLRERPTLSSLHDTHIRLFLGVHESGSIPGQRRGRPRPQWSLLAMCPSTRQEYQP